MGQKLNAKVIDGKARRKVAIRRTKDRWVDNIKMDLREMEWVGMDWIGVAQDRNQSLY
jgi:hypothetical protein